MSITIKSNTHLVLKHSDLEAVELSVAELNVLNTIVKKVQEYRKIIFKEESPKYYVINKDEPYADRVLEIILNGEHTKECRCQQQ